MILLLVCFARTPPLASAETAKVACGTLTSASSTDKSRYALTATSFGDTSDITGYRFDFGDHQSYVFMFDAAGPKQDRNKVNIEHTYASQGIYTAVVYVETQRGGKTDGITSTGCRTVVAYGPTRLLNTGAGDTPALFAAAFVVGLLASEAWFIYFRGRQ